MEHQYQQFVHHITALFLAEKPDRAINIIQHLMQQGVRSHELVVLLSYGKWIKGGPKEGLKVLKDSDCCGPLVDFVKAQYFEEMGNLKKAADHMQHSVGDATGSVLGSVSKRMEIFLTDAPPPLYSQSADLQTQQELSAINKSNSITTKLKQNLITKHEAQAQYQEILQQPLNHQLRQHIKNNIKLIM